MFDSKSEMAKLTDITWKYMQQEINNVLANSKDKIVILDWILLPITEYLNKCDIKILLDIPYQVRIWYRLPVFAELSCLFPDRIFP